MLGTIRNVKSLMFPDNSNYLQFSQRCSYSPI